MSQKQNDAGLDAILAYKRVGPLLATAGQPTAEQFSLIGEAGFAAVVNLATDKSSGHIPDEPEIVRALGMEHVHIPVAWDNPRLNDFLAFQQALDRFAGLPVFVHCAKNWRVSAFVFLDRVLRQNADPAQAIWDVRAIWEPDAVWTAFMQSLVANRGKDPF